MTYWIPVLKKSSLSAVLRQKYESLWLLLVISMMGSLLDYLTEQDFLFEIIPHHKTESMSSQFWEKDFVKLFMWTCSDENTKRFPAFSQWWQIFSQNSFQTVSVLVLWFIWLCLLNLNWLSEFCKFFLFFPVFITSDLFWPFCYRVRVNLSKCSDALASFVHNLIFIPGQRKNRKKKNCFVTIYMRPNLQLNVHYGQIKGGSRKYLPLRLLEGIFDFSHEDLRH